MATLSASAAILLCTAGSSCASSLHWHRLSASARSSSASWILLTRFCGSSTARVRQQTGAAFAKQLATILSHALASDYGPHTAVADRVQARLSAYRAVTATLAEDYHELPDTYASDEPEAQADARYLSTEEEDAIVAQVRGLEQQVAQLQRQVATPLHIVVDIQGQEIQLLLRPVLHTARPPSSMYPSAKRYVEQLPALSDKEHTCHAINLCSLALLLHAPISLTAIH